MATEALGANTGVNEIGFWSNPSNVTSPDLACTGAGGTDLDHMYCTFLAGNISDVGSFDAFHFRVVAGIFDSGGGLDVFISKDGGSTYCAGHDISGLLPAAGCSGALDSGWVLCDHAEAPSSEADWEATDNRLRLSRGTGNSTVNADYVEIRATYTIVTSYPNDVLGVASANIGKINGVVSSTIAKVQGV